jgi:hypothetical protein
METRARQKEREFSPVPQQREEWLSLSLPTVLKKTTIAHKEPSFRKIFSLTRHAAKENLCGIPFGLIPHGTNGQTG